MHMKSLKKLGISS